jgi:hypothetical protein
VRRLAGAFGRSEAQKRGSKVPHPKRFAPAIAHPILIICGAMRRGMASDEQTKSATEETQMKHAKAGPGGFSLTPRFSGVIAGPGGE